VDRSVKLSRKPTQPNRGGGSGCYPLLESTGKNCGGSAEKVGARAQVVLWERLVGAGRLVGRGFGGNGRMVTTAVEKGRVGIGGCTPAGR